MAILEVHNIEKHFGPTRVLEDISFDLEQGQALAIIGSSGSGKTTLLRCLNFLETPNQGSIAVGGNVIFDAADMNIEPGYSIRRDFTVENRGTAEVYYRVYLENAAGPLLDVLDFAIYDGDTLLFEGAADSLTRETPCEGAAPLAPGETRTLTAVVKMREGAGNTYQNGGITFDMTAYAVQVRNNPERAFA